MLLATWLPLACLALASAMEAGDERVNAPDRVELVDGGTLEGRVLLEVGDSVVLRVGAKERELARADVKSVRSAQGSLRELLEQWQHVPPGDAAAILDLARFADSRGLAGERELFALLALTVDGKLAAAHELLGHDAKGDDWIVRAGARRIPWSKLGAARRDFKDPWELATTHYELRSNLPLVDACRILIELESFYAEYMELLGRPLLLREVEVRMPLAAHADQQSFPESQGGGTGWFAPATNSVSLLFLSGLEPQRLIEMATLQLDWSVCGGESGKGHVPDWLDLALSFHLSARRTGEPGRPSYDPELFLPGLYRTHAEAKKPYDLGRVTSFTSGDFAGTSRTDLKYAQCYTLLHFLWTADEGAYQERLFDYLALAFAGKATSSSLERCLDLKERAIEEAWNAHVAKLGRR